MIDSTGLLKISSSSVYDKLQYRLIGAQAVIVDSTLSTHDGVTTPATIQIRLDPRLQLEGTLAVVFRLATRQDDELWSNALGG